MSYIFLPLQW